MLSWRNIFLGLKHGSPPKSNNIMMSLDVIIMFWSSIFPVKRLIFMMTNGANEKYEVSKVCYRGATYFWA